MNDIPDGMKRALRRAMAKMADDDDDESESVRKPRPITEAILAVLKESAELFQKPCQYKVGDLVMPRRGRGYRNPGEPAIVIEVPDEPHRNFHAGSELVTSQTWGRRMDMRVTQYVQGDFVQFWVESPDYEPYSEEQGK